MRNGSTRWAGWCACQGWVRVKAGLVGAHVIIHGLDLAAINEAIAVNVDAIKLLARLIVFVFVVSVRVLGDVLMVRERVVHSLVRDSGRLHLLHYASE